MPEVMARTDEMKIKRGKAFRIGEKCVPLPTTNEQSIK
jgi:hypothetical protein